MKERPILFSAPMVRAILDGSKTQTRRIMKVQPSSEKLQLATCIDTTGNKKHKDKHHWIQVDGLNVIHNDDKYFSCPYGYAGDRLWVRETFNNDWCNKVIYKADGGSAIEAGYTAEPKWKPSIFMPRWASRITLEITGVRVERLHDISEKDAIAEGTPWNDCAGNNREGYKLLWESINGAESWATNPWVWVVEFKVLGN